MSSSHLNRSLLSISIAATISGLSANECADAASESAPSVVAHVAPVLEEVTVTARRRVEDAQSTPISVTAFASDFLEKIDVKQVENIGHLVPNLVIEQGSGGPATITIGIRGILATDPLLTQDSPIGVYVDGVYLGRTFAQNLDLVSLERIEVLRGPQGTLFGRNTTGGAVSVITKTPEREFGISNSTNWGKEEGISNRLEVDTGNWGDSGLRAKFAWMVRDREGYVDNPINDASAKDPGALSSNAFWAKVVGEWGGLTASYAYEDGQMTGQPLAFQVVAMSDANQVYYGQSPQYGGDPLILTGDRRDTVPLYFPPGFPEKQQHDFFGHTLNVDYQINDGLLFKSISAYRGFDAHVVWPTAPHFRGPVIDFVTGQISVQDVTLFRGEQSPDQHQYSQEFQLQGESPRFDYVLGLYGFYEEVHEDNPQDYTFVLPGNIAFNGHARLIYSGISRSYAAFAQGSYRPASLDGNLELSGGIRYTLDERKARTSDIGVPERTGEEEFSYPSYLASVSYKFTPDLMAYAKISTGRRAGGFNVRQSDPTKSLAFKPEEATSFEVGMKSEWFSNRLRANVSAFYTDNQHLQVNTFDAGEDRTYNVDAEIQGIEIEVQAIVTDGLQLDASVGYLDPEYKEFPYPVYDDFGQVVLEDIADIAHFPHVPDWTAHAGAEYTFPLDIAGRLAARVDYSYSSKRYFAVQGLSAAESPSGNPTTDAIADPGQYLLNARLMLSEVPILSDRGTMRVQLYGTNLLDDELRVVGVDLGSLGFGGVQFGPPRSYGVEVSFDF